MIKYPLCHLFSKDKTPFDEYKNAAEGNTILNAIEKQVQNCYNDYENAIKSDSVHNVSPHGFINPEKDILKNLYKSNCNVAKKVRERHNAFTNDKRQVYNNKCPYCTLSEPDTIEHILPKEKYPEFAIHLYNLIPCCSKCNRYKGEKIRDKAGIPYVLNFYYHNPEIFQFLEVDCVIDSDGYPSFKYKLAFPSNADSTMIAIIINHFNRLRLIERYNKEIVKSYNIIELIITAYGGKSLEERLQSLKYYYTEALPKFGLNHHFLAMLRCLITSSTYHDYLQSKL